MNSHLSTTTTTTTTNNNNNKNMMMDSQSSLTSLDILESGGNSSSDHDQRQQQLQQQEEQPDDSLNHSLISLDVGGEHSERNQDEGTDDCSAAPLIDVRRETERIDQVKALLLSLHICCGTLFVLGTYFTQEESSNGILYGAIVALLCLIQIAAFFCYTHLVQSRQEAVMKLATQSKTIIDSLFPSNVRSRLLKQASTSIDGAEDNLVGETSHHTNNVIVKQKESSDNSNKTLTAISASPEMAPPSTPMRGAKRFLLRQDVRGKTALKQFLDNGVAMVAPTTTTTSDNTTNKAPNTNFIIDQPIADHFSNCTVLFIDIAGFTAWSADRDPPQVFCLLETLYSKFDDIAEKLNVFKVETIGDSYMAVTGLPEPNKHHATNMVRFAYQCLSRMTTVTDQLEATLGPGTKDLGIRIGINSGPVTAGVLRGRKSRFQLFGDTVNTASRMESTGARGKIQVSKETAELLVAAGKSRWIQPRENKIEAKGKGKLATFWVVPTRTNPQSLEDLRQSSCTSLGLDGSSTSIALETANMEPDALEAGLMTTSLLSSNEATTPMQQSFRMENSCTSLQLGVIMDCSEEGTEAEDDNFVSEPVPPPRRAPPLRRMPEKLSIVTASKRHIRLTSDTRDTLEEKCSRLIDWNTDVLMQYLEGVMTYRQPITSRSVMEVNYEEEPASMEPALDLVSDVIAMPDFDSLDNRKIPLSATTLEKAEKELRTFVSEIAVLYNDIPFHNFEHASHVALSANKLIRKMTESETADEQQLHEQSFGISSDPLVQFTMIFACLIHDVGHIGVPNSQLVKEKAPVALRYKNKSIAEQNSVAIGWQLLMEPRYQFLRSCIYKTNVERKRFRQVLVNSVMCTDLHDDEINRWRLDRWNTAFKDYGETEPTRELFDRKATVVIENLIQMADIAHTMQHWPTYRRWNDRLFEEAANAHRIGRGSINPAATWYQEEVSFFDRIAIPLAQRIKAAGIFGPGGAQVYVSHVEENRNEWQLTGKSQLAELLKEKG